MPLSRRMDTSKPGPVFPEAPDVDIIDYDSRARMFVVLRWLLWCLPATAILAFFWSVFREFVPGIAASAGAILGGYCGIRYREIWPREYGED